MNCSLRLIVSLTVCVATRAVAQAPTSDQAPAGPGTEWSSTSGAKTAAPLPSSSPMAEDLGARAPAPKPADVPLPPPPRGTALVPAQQGAAAPSTYSAPPATAAGVAPAAKPTGEKAPAVQEYSAPGAGPDSAGNGGAKEPKVKFGADQTGAMVQVTQDLESDKLRQDWAAAGGTLPAFEASLGMMLMYKDLSQTVGAGSYMNGVGLSGGFRVAMLNLEPPKYETRDTGWFAWKLGVGMDLGAVGVTVTTPTYTVAGRTYGGPQSASMSSFSMVFLLGGMKAFGSFDSPSEWSGMAIGFDWAPSWQQTTMTMSAAGSKPQTSSSFNAMGFDVTFESGSMQSMAAKLGKKARMKVTLFVLPPTGDLPFLMSANIGANWY